MTSPRRSAGWIALACVVAWSVSLRLGVIAAGSDPDIDGYAHFQIARRLAERWRDMRTHWVWLPLWHAVDHVIYRLGGSITTVRHLSVACAALSSFVLAWLLRAHLDEHPSPSPWLAPAEEVIPFAAGALLAVWPQNLSVGASAEPEALFQFLMLVAIATWQRRWTVATGLALSLAALLRYEAWPVLPVFFAMWWRGGRSARGAVAWVAPGVAVVAWCALHRWNTGEWFWFLKENRRYVAGAWREFALVARAPMKLRYAPVWYAVIVPYYSLRGWIPALVPGVAWLVTRGPRAFVTVSAALLAIVTFVWVARTNLGLERHFAVLIPAYATMAVAGIAASIAGAAWLASRARREVALAAVVIALAYTGGRYARTWVRWRATLLRHQNEVAYASQRRAAEILRAQASPRAPIFTDDTIVEVLSNLPVGRFIRWKAYDVRDFNVLVECAHFGEAWVASTPANVTQLHDGIVEFYRDDKIVLMRRRTPPPAITPWLLGHRSAL